MKYLITFLMVTFIGFGAIAEKPPPESGEKSSVTDQIPDIVVSEGAIDPETFLGQVIEVVQNFGGLSTMTQVAAVIMLLISSMKVSALREILWDKLGWLKAWVPPLLGLVAGFLGFLGDDEFSLATTVAYLGSGAGAIILHELLNTIKGLPGVGPLYDKIIEAIQEVLGGGKKML